MENFKKNNTLAGMIWKWKNQRLLNCLEEYSVIILNIHAVDYHRKCMVKKKDDFLWESTACHRRCTLIQNIPLAKSAGNLFHQKPGQDDVMCFRYSNQSANTHLHMSTSVCFADKKITGFKKQRSPSDLLRSGNTYSLFLSVVSQQTSVWNRRSVYSGPDKHLCPA